ncbi:MAG: outer membrane protein assembly factor BamA [candidate division WOR-3 bacterium]|nr:outer membrane protein assembly factor BamA [candidate division WOR-3 bacterium]
MKYRLTLLTVLIIMTISIYALEDARIIDIRVENNNYSSKEYIINRSGLDVGPAPQPEIIKRAVRDLYSTGIFEQVEIYAEKTGTGNVLIISVMENRRIDNILIKGNKAIKNDEIKDVIDIREGNFISDNMLFEMQDKIELLYEEKGFLNAEVSIETSDIAQSRADLIIRIEENKQVRIRHIEIFGNWGITDDKVKSRMNIKSKALFRGGIFKEKEFKEDKQTIIAVIKENGFPDAELDSVVKDLSYDKKWLTLKIYVTQGDKYYFGTFDYSGNDEIEDRVIERFISIRPMTKFNQNTLDEMVGRIYEYYMNNGFIYVSVEPQEERTDSVIDYHLNITENKQAVVRFIDILGNEKTEDRVIRREILARPGEIFRRSEVVLSSNNLYRSGLLENVMINPRPLREKGMVDIEFDVVEKETGQFNIGAQYNQVDGITGNLKVGLNNIMGKGVSSSILLEKGQRITNFNGSFTEPYLMGYPVLLGVDGYYITKDYTYYNDRRTGGKIRTGYTLSERFSTKIYLTYKLENVHLYTDTAAVQFLDPWIQDQLGDPKMLSELSPSIVRDTRNHSLYPTAGQLTGLYLNFAGSVLGGQIDYWKISGDIRHYQNLPWKFVLMTRMSFGVVDGYSDPNTVPLSERFRLGGVGYWGLRGYYDRGVGPYLDAYCIGGRGALLANIELRMKLNEQAYILAFYDIGNAWENMTEAYNNNFTPLYQGTGLGVRMEIPMMGILGIDLGYGFTDTRHAGGQRWEPHFQIGTTF